ncbi:cyclic nucleotide-binding domain-containing protein [Rubrimonas cliftonensis]|uniref:Putative ABC transport system ATP-binding protein n=1 Tax=Rubrimonas cliftonensis TaxID=89524 RepID=A0A1H4FSH5_9RHOB|nr:cyclic nucleotide-binding domain-containing protein [Rubrimonas cliftonensis]SEA99780.1 putative ABC transport system ATP-binding protein [Rubrimonas cliftonensis]
MTETLVGYIWRSSKWRQIGVLGVTLLSFPFLYATLELPKRIVNDAISGGDAPREVAGVALSQVELLALLCLLLLVAILGQGLMKMRVNTMKGKLAERLLQDFRRQLIQRVLRFPRPHLRRTSQGEIVSMITGETEPLGGIMGDLIAQPVFQGGMMLTILGFLYLQNPWLGIAAAALIPVQAILIPAMQRRINLLNKQRVAEVRRFAEEIGENAAGACDLRVAGGWTRRLAMADSRLGRLAEIRFQIYERKFFLKFVNNLITQMTPLTFYAFGGWLAIRGDLTIGALVAAVAAHKDLSAPWKELLLWWNQSQEMSMRWRVLVERFEPRGLLPEALFEGRPADHPRLNGAIALENVTVRDAGGGVLLDELSVTLPAGGLIAVASRSEEERRAVAELLTRETTPTAGRVRIGGADLGALHQATIAARVGYAGPGPYVFAGRIGENLTLGLDPAGAQDGPEARAALLDWWLQLTDAMETTGYLFDTGLDRRFDAAEHPELARRLAALRLLVAERLAAAGLSGAVHRFDPETFNPGLPVGGNLMFAVPTRDVAQEHLAKDSRFLAALDALGLAAELQELGGDVLAALRSAFGGVGAEHPMFRRLAVDEAFFAKLLGVEAQLRDRGARSLAPWQRRLLQTVPFRFSAEQIGAAFPEPLKEKIMALRLAHRDALRAAAGDAFAPLREDEASSGLSVLENAVFGKIALAAGAAGDKARRLVAQTLEAEGLRGLIAELIYDAPTTVGGANLPPVAYERIAFVRAALKRPDILILDRALASHDRDSRLRMRRRLRDLLPETTLIFLEEDFVHRDSFDLYLEIEEGRLVGDVRAAREDADPGAADLRKKVAKLEKAQPFRGLDRRQLRLLAFGSTWVKAGAGEALFRTGDPPDGAYLIVAGGAELRAINAAGVSEPFDAVAPGRVIGDLAVILDEPRRLDLVATTPLTALRIDARAMRAVIESDISVTLSLLRTVSGHLVEAGEELQRSAHGGGREAEPLEPKAV